MDRRSLIRRIRSYTRDTSGNIFVISDLHDFINESIDRIRSRIPELSKMTYLTSDDQSPSFLPEGFHFLIAVYAASRCFTQDERHYQSSTLMNEFEIKMEELISMIQDGTIQIKDTDGKAVDAVYVEDSVVDVYFKRFNSDDDLGVDGVE